MDTLGNEIRSWLIAAWILLRYAFYRIGLGRCPTFRNHLTHCVNVMGRLFKWHRRVRVVDPEKCPQAHPAILCCNHMKKDDPFVVGAYIHTASGGTIWVHQMMRDDFFGENHGRFLYDLNELVAMLGTYQISRDKVTLAQLKVFVELLRNDQSFLLFPGRTRSRSGLFMDYRDGIDEPGGPSFFVAQVQRSDPKKRVALGPVARNFNPATKRTTIAFTEPLYLESGADRIQQRELDYRVVEIMGDTLRAHMTNLVSGLLYLRCLHGMTDPLSLEQIQQDVASVIRGVPEKYIDPLVREDLAGELGHSLQYLALLGAVIVQDDRVVLNASSILSCPEYDTSYATANPVKYATNQVLHLRDVTMAMEAVVLGQAD